MHQAMTHDNGIFFLRSEDEKRQQAVYSREDLGEEIYNTGGSFKRWLKKYNQKRPTLAT
jgi:hypothetical protein